MIRAMASRPVAMPPAVVAGQQIVQRLEQIPVRPCPELEDDEPGSGVRHEDVQQSIARAGDEARARRSEVGEPGIGAGANRQLGRLQRPLLRVTAIARGTFGAPWTYGKMLRSASRRRPSPPDAGADS